MATETALARFQEARSADAGSASVHGEQDAGLERCQRLADALDEALRELAAGASAEPFAVVAVGGYGRREQCRHSDIDLMLLVEHDAPGDAVSRVLYPLWGRRAEGRPLGTQRGAGRAGRGPER